MMQHRDSQQPIWNQPNLSRRIFLGLGGGLVVGAGLGLDRYRRGLLAATRETDPALQTAHFVAMGTFLDITTTRAVGPMVIQSCLACTERLERRLTYFAAASEVGRLNRAAPGASVKVGDDLRRLLAAAAVLHAESGGAFDPTVAPLLRAWGLRGPHPPRRPAREELRRLSATVGLQKLRLGVHGAGFEVPGAELDLGGIGKGYIVDQAAAHLEQQGLAGVINGGGDIRVVGRRPDGRPWIVGIRHPRRQGTLIARALLRPGAAVATSGVYQQAVRIDGKDYPHLIDPRSGEPAAEVLSATVVSPNAMLADALATAACVLGASAGLRWLAQRSDAEGLLVTRTTGDRIQVDTTPGFPLG